MPGLSTVNETLATYSDYAFRTALVIYLAAVLVHLGEYARGRVNAVVGARATVRVGVGGGPPTAEIGVGGGPPTVEVGNPGGGEAQPGAPAAPRSRTERFGRTAVALTILGAGLHLGSVALRGAAAQRWPWGNMYEFCSAICLMAVLAWLLVLRRAPRVRPIGAFVLLPVVVLMFLGGTVLYVAAAPVMPALQSYWLAIHVTAASIASGLLLVAGVASALFLVPRPVEPGPAPTGVSAMLPAREALDRVAYRTTVIAFPIWTFAVMTGAIWAEAAWGRFWGWDPKETVAFVAWVVYAGYLHARATAGWRGGGAAWVNVAGFIVMLFNLFFVNLVTAGLHSYAGVN